MLTPTRTHPGADAAADELTPPTRRAAEIRATLQDQIESGQRPPGSVLDEKALTQEFGVSRTPVREALQQLAANGLVRMQHRQGVTVSRLTVNQVRGLLEFFCEMEVVMAGLAARRMTADLADRLHAALAECERCVKAADVDAYEKANIRFHEVVYAAAHNEYMVDVLRNTRRMIKRYRVKPRFNQRQMEASYADHLAIVRAIEAGDEVAIAQAIRKHVPFGNSGFAEFLALVPPEYFGDDGGKPPVYLSAGS